VKLVLLPVEPVLSDSTYGAGMLNLGKVNIMDSYLQRMPTKPGGIAFEVGSASRNSTFVRELFSLAGRPPVQHIVPICAIFRAAPRSA